MTSSPAPQPIEPSRGGAAASGVPRRPAAGERTRWGAALACAVAGTALFQFFGNANHGYIDTASLFWWWVYQWINPGSETQHGWLILAIAGWLLARNLGNAKGETRNAEARRSQEPGVRTGEAGFRNQESGCEPCAVHRPWSAMVAMLAGLALHALGFVAQQGRISILALLIFAWGVLRLGGGPRWGRAAAFPLGFMVFAVPLNVLDSVGFWLRLWVIDASAGLAHALHIGVLQNGTQLTALDGRYNYDVAAACSGVRSLMALAALSLLIGYLNFRTVWRRAVILLLCFPLVYFGNVVRITSIVVAAQLGGTRWGDRAHEIMGYGIFVIVLGGVLAATAALRRGCPERSGTAAGRAAPSEETRARSGHVQPAARRALAPWTAAAVVVLVAVIDLGFLHRMAALPERGGVGVVLAADGRNPADLPAFIDGTWVGLPAQVTPIEREILPPDTGYSRINYVSSRDRRTVFLSIVLSGRDRTSIHRPELCLVGQGWTIAGRTVHTFAYPGAPDASFPATILRVRREQRTPRGPVVLPQLVAYWFVDADAVVATHWQRLARDAWNRVAHGRADRWAYVLMQTDATDGDAAALARMQDVLNGALPSFQRPIGGSVRR